MTFDVDFSADTNFNVNFSAGTDFVADLGVLSNVSTTNYNTLINKPSIENITLTGNKTFADLGISAMTVQEIEQILYL